MHRLTPDLAYAHLVTRSREVSILASCLTLLDWDEQTYMPPGGAENRANQMAYLAGLQHEKSADPRIGEWLDVVEASDLAADPDLPAAVNVTQWRRQFQRLARLPRELVEQQARAASLGQQAWHSAKQDCDFTAFRPFLEKVIDLKREEAACLVDGNSASSYDVLLDEYEPGCTAAQLHPLFDALRRELGPLRERLAGRRHSKHFGLLRRSFPVDRQRLFCEAVAET
jgi:carboxypeptidase Taq